MVNIDDLIEVKKANQTVDMQFEKYNSLQRELSDIYMKISELQEELNDKYDRCDKGEFREPSIEILESIDEIEDELKKLREQYKQKEEALEDIQIQYEQSKTMLDNLLKEKGIEPYVEGEMHTFLENLVSTKHITTIGEKPEEFFKKLIELYGEDELADFTSSYQLKVTNYKQDKVFADNNYVFSIADFISGNEDKVIGLVSNDKLRKRLLASKLIYLNEKIETDSSQCIQEYVDVASEKGYDTGAYLDEYGGVEVEKILSDFLDLPISKDKNFYLYLAKYLDEMQMPFETLCEYINPNMIDDEFGSELAYVSNTKQYEYQDKFAYVPNLEGDKDLLAWLQGKEKELSSLEKEAKEISETEALKEKLEEKEGQDIGDE